MYEWSRKNFEKRLSASSCPHTRPSVRPHRTTRFHLDGFSWNSIFVYILGIVKVIQWFFFLSPKWCLAYWNCSSWFILYRMAIFFSSFQTLSCCHLLSYWCRLVLVVWSYIKLVKRTIIILGCTVNKIYGKDTHVSLQCDKNNRYCTGSHEYVYNSV